MIHAAFPAQAGNFATISLSAHRSAQGPVLQEYGDGRVMIDTGNCRLVGLPLNRPARTLGRMPILGLGY